MNAKPHTHEPKLERRNGKARWVLVYGDTTVTIPRTKRKAPSPERVKKALAKAVRLHDQGSIAAGERQARIQAAKEAAMLPVTDKAWGEDLLSGKVELEPEVPEESVQERNARLDRERRNRQYEQEREAQRRREEAIMAVRAEHWKQGQPEKKVRVDGYGHVVEEMYDLAPSYVEVVEPRLREEDGYYTIGG